MVNDVDVDVATSVRTRRDFRDMANDCEKIFADERLRELNIRYFDPTLSAAAGHEDKGLIECRMVKCSSGTRYSPGTVTATAQMPSSYGSQSGKAGYFLL